MLLNTPIDAITWIIHACSCDVTRLLRATLLEAGHRSGWPHTADPYSVNWKIMKNFKFSSLLLAPLFVVLAACGGGGGGDSSTPSTPAVATLKSIAVTAPNATIPIGASQTLVATGTYSDGTTKALNTASGIIWAAKSGSTTVLQVFTSGIVTGKGVGSETISATQGGVVGTITIAVTSPWTQVSAGGYQTIARKADGNLYSWGSNIAGQLGDSTTIDRSAPVLVSSGGAAATATWKQIAVGDQYAVGIRAGTSTTTAGGTLWAWGFNQNSQLGDGTTVNKSAPVQVGKDTDWVFVSVGKRHVLAIKANGLLYSWGSNTNGQLGDGTTVPRSVPTKVPVPTGSTWTWSTVSAGETHSLGIQKDGTLWSWGGGVQGQLGNGVTADIGVPAKVGTLSWASVSAGSLHSMAIRADGTLWGWGANGSGQVGNNGTSQQTTPAPITTDTNWAVIAAGTNHTMGVRTDGTLWGWGSNAEGQLGNGDTDTFTPVQIGTRTNWTTVSSGVAHSFGMQSDNTLWGWGRNQEGQIGNGSKSPAVPLPVSIPN